MHERDQVNSRDIHHHHYDGCCGICGNLFGAGQPGGTIFWGLALLAIGSMWIAGNLFGFDNWGEWVGPALLVIVGAGMLVNLAGDRAPS